jgi:plastocyanin
VNKRFRLAVLVGGAVAALAVPMAAQAATKTVYMGPPPSASKQFEPLQSDVNDFFPHAITIHAGDSIAFQPGFHNVDLPKKGGRHGAFIAPRAGATASSVSDEAGNPFWFNGQQLFGVNLAMVAPKKRATYDGKKAVVGSVPVLGKPYVFTVKFPKTGTYTYYCDIHGGMKGVIRVVPKAAKIPSQKDDARTIKNQVAADLKAARSLRATKPPAGVVDVGVAGPRGVEYFNLVGPSGPVPVGTTLRFTMTKGSFETHTATTGPGDPGNEQDTTSYLGKLAATFQGGAPFDPRAIYPSDQPGGAPASLTPQLHGNGFWNSGAIDLDNATPLPPSNSVRFDAPGSYTFYCLIHPFMKTTITVG